MSCRRFVARCELYALSDTVVGTSFTVMYYTYFAVVRGGLEVFDCSARPDGRRVLGAEPW